MGSLDGDLLADDDAANVLNANSHRSPAVEHALHGWEKVDRGRRCRAGRKLRDSGQALGRVRFPLRGEHRHSIRRDRRATRRGVGIVTDPAAAGRVGDDSPRIARGDQGAPRERHRRWTSRCCTCAASACDVRWTAGGVPGPSLAPRGRVTGPPTRVRRTEYVLRPFPEGSTRFDYRNEFHRRSGGRRAGVVDGVVARATSGRPTRTLERLRSLLDTENVSQRHVLTHC